MQRVGSRAQVMRGTAKMTSGGLMKKHLTYNNSGKIVSKKASKTAKKLNKLVKAGYITKKGQFGAVRSIGGADKFGRYNAKCYIDKNWKDVKIGDMYKYGFGIFLKQEDNSLNFAFACAIQADRTKFYVIDDEVHIHNNNANNQIIILKFNEQSDKEGFISFYRYNGYEII